MACMAGIEEYMPDTPYQSCLELCFPSPSPNKEVHLVRVVGIVGELVGVVGWLK